MKNVMTQAQQVLLDELNEVYISLTGEGISPEFYKELMNGGVETIHALIDEQKMFIAQSLAPADFRDESHYEFDNDEPLRCDSIEFYYVDAFEAQPPY